MRGRQGKCDREAKDYTEEEGDIDTLEESFVRGGDFGDTRGNAISRGLWKHESIILYIQIFVCICRSCGARLGAR